MSVANRLVGKETALGKEFLLAPALFFFSYNQPSLCYASFCRDLLQRSAPFLPNTRLFLLFLKRKWECWEGKDQVNLSTRWRSRNVKGFPPSLRNKWNEDWPSDFTSNQAGLIFLLTFISFLWWKLILCRFTPLIRLDEQTYSSRKSFCP